jgi:diguanylate cyclase (GGDEF)-like protein/PAS domain S-box-containing protein
MQGSFVEIVPLVLLVVFFVLQQRNQKQLYYRFWFAGWIFLLCSYVLWEIQGRLNSELRLLEVVRIDFVLLGALTFMTSFLTREKNLPRVALMGLAVGIPNVIVVDLQHDHAVSKVLLVLAVVAWHAYGLYAACVLIPRNWRFRRTLVIGLCLSSCVAMLLNIWLSTSHDLYNWALAETFLCTMVLYGVDHKRRTLAGLVGSLGYFSWAVFYLLSMWMENKPTGLHLLYDYWNFPKYFVAFSMIMKIFEDSRDEQVRLANEYRQLYDDFRILYESHPNPMWIYAEATDKILSVNRAAVHSYGYTEEEFLAMTADQLEVPEDHETELADDLVPQTQGVRMRHMHRDGKIVWVNVQHHAIRFKDMAARLIQARDITERLRLNMELARRAHHDALTGLPNRSMLEDRMARALERSIREGKKTAVLSIDIDHFKDVNDTHGHLTGDDCLKAVAHRMQAKIRSIDTLARTGGEEFVALIGALSQASDAEKVAASLLKLFEEPMQLPGVTLKVTVSIGVAVFPDDGHDAETLRKRSDEALYRAKRNGRNRVETAGRLGPLGSGVSLAEPVGN